MRLKPNQKLPLTRFLSRDEIGRLHEVLDRHATRGEERRQADIIRLLLLTGLEMAARLDAVGEKALLSLIHEDEDGRKPADGGIFLSQHSVEWAAKAALRPAYAPRCRAIRNVRVLLLPGSGGYYSGHSMEARRSFGGPKVSTARRAKEAPVPLVAEVTWLSCGTSIGFST